MCELNSDFVEGLFNVRSPEPDSVWVSREAEGVVRAVDLLDGTISRTPWLFCL